MTYRREEQVVLQLVRFLGEYFKEETVMVMIHVDMELVWSSDVCEQQ